MNTKRFLISGITALVAVILILVSVFSNSVLIAGTWTPDLTDYEIDEITEETGRLYDEKKETTIFGLFGDLEYNTKGEKPVSGSFSFDGNKISMKLGKDKAVKSFYKVTDDALRIYENEEDYFLDNTTDYKRLGGLSLAMIIRIVGLVLLVAAVVLFFVLNDHKAPVNYQFEAIKKFIYAGALGAVAILLVVLTFINTTWQIAGTWRPRYTDLQKAEYESNYGEKFNPYKHLVNFNVYGRMYAKSKDLTEGYEYKLNDGKIYQKMLTEDEPGVFIDDGGSTNKRLYDFKNGYLYIYDSEEQRAQGYFNKYESVGLSFAWLMRIVAIVLIAVAALIVVFYKGKTPEELEEDTAPVAQ